MSRLHGHSLHIYGAKIPDKPALKKSKIQTRRNGGKLMEVMYYGSQIAISAHFLRMLVIIKRISALWNCCLFTTGNMVEIRFFHFEDEVTTFQLLSRTKSRETSDGSRRNPCSLLIGAA